jgi:predicted PurR-regulated permease PerM
MSRLMETKSALKLGLVPTILASVAILYFAREVLIPLAVAVLLAFVLVPVVTWLERCRVGRIAAVLIAVGTALAVLGMVGWTVERQFVEVAEKLPDYGANIESKLRRFQGTAGGSFSKAAKGVEDTMKNMAGTGREAKVIAGIETSSRSADGRHLRSHRPATSQP